MWQLVAKGAFFVGCACFLTSCGHESEQPPPTGILAEAEIAELLLQMHLYEGVAYKQGLVPYDSMSKLQAYFQKAILKKYQIHDSTYQQSLHYYSRRPLRLERVYARVLDSLKAMKSAQISTPLKQAAPIQP